jgi:hypothetical protein
MQPDWLEQATTCAASGSLPRAIKYLERGRWSSHWSQLDHCEAAIALAAEIASRADGRTLRKAKALQEELQQNARYLRRQRDAARREALMMRALRNLKMFTSLAISGDAELADGMARQRLTVILGRLERWREPLLPAFGSGYAPFQQLGAVPMSDVERVRLTSLMAEVATSVALAHAEVVDDLGELRTCRSACVGYAAACDDVRVSELIGTLQRLSGSSVEMPTDVAVSTVVLDAMQAAAPAREERGLFKLTARWAMYVGLGAGVADAIEPPNGDARHYY